MRSSAIVVGVAVALAIGVAATEPADSPSDSLPADPEPAESGGGPPADLEFQIDVLLGVVSPEEAEEHHAAIEEENQRRLQDCMAAAGFEYELELLPQPAVADPTAELTDVEFAEQWGFGIYTLLAPEGSAALDVSEEFAWPNEGIVDALSPDDRDAWFDAHNACTAAIWAGGDPWNNPMVADVFDEFFTIVEADPRVGDALAEFVACMDEAGYGVEHPDDAYDLVYDPELLEQFWVTAAWEPDSIDHDIWLEAVALEIDIAVAVASCSPGYFEMRTTVAGDHRDELVAALAEVDWSLEPVPDDGFDAEHEAFVPDTDPDA